MTGIEEQLDKKQAQDDLGKTEAQQDLDFTETEKQLDSLEAAIAIQDYSDAYNILLRFLQSTSVHRSREEKIFAGFSEEQVQYIATRFAGAVSFLFLQKSFKLNELGFRRLVTYQSNYASIVYLTPLQNCDHIIRRILDMKEDGTHSDDISLPSFLKMLFLWSPYSKIQLPFKSFLEQYPQFMTPVMLSVMRSLNYIEENSHGNREAIIQALADLGEFDLGFDDDHLASLAGPAWMNVSYATSFNKYDAKIPLNYSYRKWMKLRGVQEPSFPSVRKIKGKPVMIIMNEVLNQKHAMFRCYGKKLKALREKFYTIGFFTKGFGNENTHDVFDEVVIMSCHQADIKKSVGQVIKKKPDIILYTSLGMNNVAIPMAMLRLAPIQIAFMGHPNSTRSHAIDYICVGECEVPYTKNFNEKVVAVASSSPFIMLDEHRNMKRRLLEKGKKQLDIVVPSMVMKLNYDFLSVLAKIKSGVSRNIRYHFFPNVAGISLFNARKAIHNILPDSVVHPGYRYSEYLDRLSQGDLHLGPFPFNNTNGNIDSLVAGLPMVVLRGDPQVCGIEGIADVSVLQDANAPEEMIAESIDDYIMKACRLIDDDEYREDISARVRNLNLDATLFENDSAFQSVDVIWDIYMNHEKYQKNVSQVRTVKM